MMMIIVGMTWRMLTRFREPHGDRCVLPIHPCIHPSIPRPGWECCIVWPDLMMADSWGAGGTGGGGGMDVGFQNVGLLFSCTLAGLNE